MDTLITLKYIHRLHQNKIHKLTLFKNKDNRRLRADLTLKKQIEYSKDTFCIESKYSQQVLYLCDAVYFRPLNRITGNQ